MTTQPRAKLGRDRDAPEVKVLLEKVVTTDSSLAAGEVLGRRFPNLFALDRAWAKENVDRIFKPEAKLVERVAWINYILFCQAYDELLLILISQYERAVDSLGSDLDSAIKDQYERNLVAHLASFFWRGRLNWDDKKTIESILSKSLCLAKIRSAFELNDIRGCGVTRFTDEIQSSALRSVGECGEGSSKRQSRLSSWTCGNRIRSIFSRGRGWFAGIEKKGLGRKNSLVHIRTKFGSTCHWLEPND